MARPQPGTYPVYFSGYISLVETDTVDGACRVYGRQVVDFFKNLPPGIADFSYAAGKWTMKEMLQHLIDAERIFAYRTLTIARKDETPLPGFNENTYASNSNANSRTWEEILKEFEAVRVSTDCLLLTLNDEQLDTIGTTNNNPTTPRSIAYAVFGHILHHINMVNERYLPAAK